MKRKVKFGEFFSTVGLGIWQVICYLFRVFNPEHKTKFWRVIWSIITCCIVIIVGIVCYDYYIDKINPPERSSNRTWLSKNLYVYREYWETSSDCYFRNYRTGKKHFIGFDWYQIPENGGDIAVVSVNGKRGFINYKTGDVVIDAKYDRAWIFSEGLAAVSRNDSLFFIDIDGNELYKDLGLSIMSPDYLRDYVFHDGLCIVNNNEGLLGIINADGNWVLPIEYDYINIDQDLGLWETQKDGYFAILDEDSREELFGGYFKSMDVTDSTHIYVRPTDGVMQRYDISGNLLDPCVIHETRQLWYDTDELVRVKIDDDEYSTEVRKEIANCLCYSLSFIEEGLMTKTGKIITPAIFLDITAIDKDLYLCDYDGEHSVILNGRGEVVNK